MSNKSLEGYLQQKYQNRNTLQSFGGGTYSKNSKYQAKKFFLSSLYIKGLDIKMAVITKKTYENNGIEVIIQIKQIKLVNYG